MSSQFYDYSQSIPPRPFQGDQTMSQPTLGHNGSAPKPNLWLRMVQQPRNAKVAGGKDKDTKPIDPPPVVELCVNKNNWDWSRYGNPDAVVHNPHLFLTCELVSVDSKDNDKKEKTDLSKALQGVTVSSLHKVKDQHGSDAAYFVFGNLSVKVQGTFQLHFILYEIFNGEVCFEWAEVLSEPFEVHSPRSFPGLAQSTTLTKTLSDQGIRVRIRKDSHKVRTAADTARFAQAVTQKRRFHEDSQPTVVKRHRGEAASVMPLQMPLQQANNYVTSGGSQHSPFDMAQVQQQYAMAPTSLASYPLTPAATVTQSPPLWSNPNTLTPNSAGGLTQSPPLMSDPYESMMRMGDREASWNAHAMYRPTSQMGYRYPPQNNVN
ncbi:Spore development regulator vosA [Colletotrichum sp. SAR 10_65]|nr:Spore development regulator vosA [Colletotrichum sp. SAR 10_65]